MQLTSIPNLITIMRIVLAPLVVMAFFLPVEWNHLAAGWLFLFASVTDLLDGYIARKLKQESAFGAFLDPIADKIMIASVLILLVPIHDNTLFSICSILIVAREIIISALREWLAHNNETMPVSFSGKFKTFTQMFALTLLLATAKSIYGFWGIVALASFYLATFVTLTSMFSYVKGSWHKTIKQKGQ